MLTINPQTFNSITRSFADSTKDYTKQYWNWSQKHLIYKCAVHWESTYNSCIIHKYGFRSIMLELSSTVFTIHQEPITQSDLLNDNIAFWILRRVSLSVEYPEMLGVTLQESINTELKHHRSGGHGKVNRHSGTIYVLAQISLILVCVFCCINTCS